MLTSVQQFDFFLEQLSSLSKSSFSEPELYLTYVDLLTILEIPNEKQKEVITLKKQGYNTSQLAEKLGIHHSTAQERLHRAYHIMISHLLEGHFYEEDEIDTVLDTLTAIETKYKF